jgi:hypothetical protein
MRSLILFSLALACGLAQAQDGAALRQRHGELQAKLAHNPFGRALHVDSNTSGGAHRGEIHAVIEQPYKVVASGLGSAKNWCEILALQVNVKGCEAAHDALAAQITRKPRDTVENAHRIEFRFEAPARREDYLQVALRAASGPVGTRDYEILVQAAPLDAGRTFLHMTYAYKLGTMARLAMDAYLAGPGREKKGFTVEGGPRGVVERSAMRYYLAVDAYLGERELEPRLRRWYTETARYPQLREEVTLEQYAEMKRREASRTN